MEDHEDESGGISIDAISVYFRIIVTVKVEDQYFPRVVRIGIIRPLQGGVKQGSRPQCT